MIVEKSIRVKDILLWDENSRLPDNLFGKNQQEIIDTFLKDKKRFELTSLADEIVADFDLPQLEKLVLIKKNGKYVASEGNRRLVAYKCLANPKLANEYASDFTQLANSIEINENFELQCVITDNFEQANRYLERKHLRGNNEKSWGQYERDNHSARVKRSGGSADKNRIRRANIGKLVEETNLPDAMKRSVLGQGYVTNFYRIIDSSPGYKYFGFNADNDGELSINNRGELLNKLKVFVYELLTIKKPIEGISWSRAFNKSSEIEAYLQGLNTNRVAEIDKEIEKSKILTIFGEEEIRIEKSGKTIYASSKKQEYPQLIRPTKKRLKLGEKSKKIDEVYEELKKIFVKDCPTAVSVLVRVLLEVTVSRYLEVHGEHFDGNNNLIVPGQNSKTELKQKVDYIAANYAVSTAKVKGAISALNVDLYTQNLNQIVHNIGYFADEVSIRKFWKNIEMVFEFLVEGIIEKENDQNKNS
jgi:hypothetical protein